MKGAGNNVVLEDREVNEVLYIHFLLQPLYYEYAYS